MDGMEDKENIAGTVQGLQSESTFFFVSSLSVGIIHEVEGGRGD